MEFTPPVSTQTQILCCLCGIPVESNPSNMCLNCLKTQVDITEGISPQQVVFMCKSCGRFQQPPTQWLRCELESEALLTLCLKRIKGLQNVKLIDASFIWTEPHSRRIKLKITVQKEIFNGATLQQGMVIEFVVHTQQCTDCQRLDAQNTWNAVVQVRQKNSTLRTLLLLEQLILKHKAQANAVSIKESIDGMDFFFMEHSHAKKFSEFCQSMVPSRAKHSKKLVSHDIKSNIYNYKYTHHVEVAPICKNDLIFFEKKSGSPLQNLGNLLLCHKLTNILHFINPNTLAQGNVLSQEYWKKPFVSLCNAKELIEYTVIDCSPSGIVQGKYMLADVQVAKTSELGLSENMYLGRTHLGFIIQPGDIVLGYDLTTKNFNETTISPEQYSNLPDFVLVQKQYESKKRNWRLHNLPAEGRKRVSNLDMEMFLQDVETDPELQSQIEIIPDDPVSANNLNTLLEDNMSI